MSYSLLSDGTYAVSAGPDIASVTTVAIPSMHNGIAVTQILAEGFKDIVNLQQIILPEGLLEIKDNAFYGCYSLGNVSLPTTLKSIGEYAFYGCAGITEVVIPSNVNFIGKYAYSNTSLQSAYFKDYDGWNLEGKYTGYPAYYKPVGLSESANMLRDDFTISVPGGTYTYSFYKNDWNKNDAYIGVPGYYYRDIGSRS